MNLHIICNPTSGNGFGRKAAQRVLEILDQKSLTAGISYTERPLQATELVRTALDQGADTIVAIGGDGTLHEAAQALAGTPVPLGIIPAGTGNDFIKSVHIPADIEAALALILEGQPRAVDTVRINDRLFLNECGCGFDVMVLDYAEKAKKYVKGILPYLHGVIQTILHYRDIRVSYAIDGQPAVEQDMLVLGVGNGRYIGGGIPIAPSAIPDDGLLDVLTVRGMSKLRMFSVLPGLLKGKIETFPETVHQRAQRITLEGKRLRVNMDGEIITLDRADIEINPASLLVYRP